MAMCREIHLFGIFVCWPSNYSCIPLTGEDAGYNNRVFLIYNGIHYDPLAVLGSEQSGPPLQSVFPANDEKRLHEAVEIAFEAQKVGMNPQHGKPADIYLVTWCWW